jgi:hypothetical protein
MVNFEPSENFETGRTVSMEKSTTFLAVERKETYPFYENHASLEIMRREAFPRVLFFFLPGNLRKSVEGQKQSFKSAGGAISITDKCTRHGTKTLVAVSERSGSGPFPFCRIDSRFELR